MNYFLFLIKNSWGDLKRNKIRTFLTSLGILIGVMSVVLLIAFGLGLKNYIRDQFQSLGANLVIVLPGKIQTGGGFSSGAGTLGGVKFDEKDILKLKRIKEAEYVVPASTKTVSVSASGKTEIANAYLSSADIFKVRNLEVDKGRLFTTSDVDKRSKNIVMGPKIAEKIFGNPENALGKSLRIEDQGFNIVGILKSKGGGGFGGPDFDSFVYIPYKSAISLNPDKKFLALYLKTVNENDVPILKEEVKKTLLKRYKEDDFSVVEQTEILDMVNSIFTIINSILIAIGSISLIVGGVGIMNIMYASVTERIKEIGIRRAIGATKQDILMQFLSESVILSVFGGLLGLGLAFTIVILIQPLFPASISPVAVVTALLVSSFIGIFFGVFPARQAANLSPIEAIRYE